jgi:hypothetical protein
MSANLPEVKRNAFFAGQQLTAKDLTDLNLANRELQWLHTRAFHNWGTGIGLEAKATIGDSVVIVEPGFAVDSLGREILLVETQTIAVPAVAGNGSSEAIFYLVIAYKGDGDQRVLERRSGICNSSGGSVRLAEDPVLTWRVAKDLVEGQDIVLAKASVQNCRLSRDLSFTERRNARPGQQPYIYGGQTTASGTPWQKWLDAANNILGVQTLVDTSAAHFHTVPAYNAHVVGERYVSGPPQYVFVPFTAVSSPTRDQFALQVLLPNFNVAGINPLPPDLLDLLKPLHWHVVWVGVEE